jgi:2-oxoglutarate ferredoxin oxidoreductase subunit alpha
MARERGIRVGLLRPRTLFPFPYRALAALGKRLMGTLVVEMNAGQMIEDVKLGLEGAVPVSFLGRMGGVIPTPEEVLEKIVSEIRVKPGRRYEAHPAHLMEDRT